MHPYRFGIEEEYFVVNRRTAGIKCELSQAFMKAARKKLGAQLMNEILQSQVEVATPPMRSPGEARGELLRLRSTLAEVGREHGVGIVAAGTHPLAYPHQQQMTKGERGVSCQTQLLAHALPILAAVRSERYSLAPA